MVPAIDYNDAQYPALAEAILQRHEIGAAEANITSAVRDFLIATRLVAAEEIVEEAHPGDASRKAVDLTALDTYIEFQAPHWFPAARAGVDRAVGWLP